MKRAVFPMILVTSVLHGPLSLIFARAQAEPPIESVPWQTIADCAAGYRANWQNRVTGFNRSRDMSNMIQEQAQDFLAAAIRNFRQQEKVSIEAATQRVTTYVAANVDRYVAMDKAETLEAFLNQCPQIEPESSR
jgi:hypothetical protein